MLVFIGIILADVSYEYFNTYNPVDRWPAFYAWDPDTGQPVQPLTGEHPYQTFILRSWLDEKVPFIPLFAIPYISALVIWHLVVTLLTLAFGTFKRFLTLGFAFITSQLLMDLAFFLFQTNVLRDDVTVPGDGDPAAALPDGRLCGHPVGVHLLLGLHVHHRETQTRRARRVGGDGAGPDLSRYRHSPGCPQTVVGRQSDPAGTMSMMASSGRVRNLTRGALPRSIPTPRET